MQEVWLREKPELFYIVVASLGKPVSVETWYSETSIKHVRVYFEFCNGVVFTGDVDSIVSYDEPQPTGVPE